VIDLATRRGYPVIERHIAPDELPNAQEMFVTGTAAEVTPVRAVDDLHYQLGPVTKQLIDDYRGATRGHPKAA
jgi:branched-chain amino acid aminotransferase